MRFMQFDHYQRSEWSVRKGSMLVRAPGWHSVPAIVFSFGRFSVTIRTGR